MARFKSGLVVGKLSPLHRGHEALLRRALELCDKVFVISYSNPELPGCEASQRSQWLAGLFPTVRALVVTDELLRKIGQPDDEFTAVPQNDAPDTVHRDFCAFLCETHFETPVEAVFTSDDDGDAFAEHLTKRFRSRRPDAAAVKHISVDRLRINVAASGRLIRANVHAYRHWLSPLVYASFVKRICILGGESSGKSTLARLLAERFETVFVPEYGRELWEAKKRKLVYEEMLIMARRQIEQEQSATRRANQYVFCDTSPLSALFYSLALFERADPELEALSLRPYDLHALCSPDIKFVQDGTRRNADFRQRQHDWYLERLPRLGIPYLLAQGSPEARTDQIAAHLEENRL